MQQPPDEKQQLRDLGNAFNVSVWLLMAIGRTGQVWSRLPGTTGRMYYGWLVVGGLAVQGLFYQMNVARYGPDSIGFGSIVVLTFAWVAYHELRRSQLIRQGIDRHSYDPGVGLYSARFAQWDSEWANLASDLIVVMSISIVLEVFGSPILASWYAGVSLGLVLARLWAFKFEQRRVQAWQDSMFESEQFAHQVQRKK